MRESPSGRSVATVVMVMRMPMVSAHALGLEVISSIMFSKCFRYCSE